MRLWKQLQARVEPHVNRALLFSILACLVVLLTYLLGGAGAFTVFRQAVQANAASAPIAATSTTTATSGGWTSGQTVVGVNGSVVLALRVSPLDIAYDCALGASGAQQVTLTNPDGAAHPFTLSWNGPSGPAQGFVAAVQSSGSGPADTIPAHGSQQVTITGFTQLALNPTSQYLWVGEDTGGASTTVAKVHVWCSTLPPVVPTITLTPPPIP